MCEFITTYSPRKAGMSAHGVALFMEQFPCSGLRRRSYLFEFDDEWNLVDTDVPEHDDGPGALALSGDIEAYLRDGTIPDYLS